jgi:hypothetical protein
MQPEQGYINQEKLALLLIRAWTFEHSTFRQEIYHKHVVAMVQVEFHVYSS